MAYIRYKEVTRTFNFKKILDPENVPSYVKDYIYDDEKLLAVYRVGKDHGIITDKKITLFDNSQSFGGRKEITTIPYKSVTAHSIIFHPTATDIYLLMETGNPMLLKFSNMDNTDKYRLRLLYNAMSALICGQKIPNHILNKLSSQDLAIK